jgi:hypothetical protein
MDHVVDFVIAAFTTDVCLTPMSAAAVAFFYFAIREMIGESHAKQEWVASQLHELLLYRRRANEVSFGIPCEIISDDPPDEILRAFGKNDIMLL